MRSFAVLVTVALLCAVKCQSPTPTTAAHWTHRFHTHPTHQHHGHNPHIGPTDELENYVFHYDPKTHSLVVSLDHDCYIMPLSEIQRLKVHDPVGLETVEAEALQMIADNQVKTDIGQDTKDYYYRRGHCHTATAVVMLASR